MNGRIGGAIYDEIISGDRFKLNHGHILFIRTWLILDSQ